MKVALVTVLRDDMLQHYNKVSNLGIDIDVLTNGQEPKSLFSSRQYIASNNLNERIYHNDDEFFSILKEYDLISAYEFYGPRQMQMMERFNNFIGEIAWNVPTYGTLWYRQEKLWGKRCLELAKTKAAGFIAKSQSAYDCLTQEGIDQNKIKIIPGSVDIDIFQPRKKPKKWQNKKVVLFVGRVSYQKGLVDIFHIFKKAAVENSILILIGPYSESAWEIVLIKKWIHDLGMDDQIIFYGTVNPQKIHEIYTWGDVFMTLPNADVRFVEQIGLTVPQALASGLPVLTYNYGGQAEFIDNSCGCLVSYRDYATAAQYLRELLTNDMLRFSMSMNARKKAMMKFSSNNFAQKIQKYYKKVLACIKK